MKLNVSYPATGCQKLFEVVNDHELRVFYEERMGQIVGADILGDEWKGYMLHIAGGNDKHGFPMKQGFLTHGRVRLLLKKGHSCYHPRRTGERKSVQKATSNAPKVQRLVTLVVLQRKRRLTALKKKRQTAFKEAAADYAKLLAQKKKESKAKRQEAKRRRSASIKESKSSSDKKY